MWEAIKYVTSGLTLVAFIAAAVTWLLKSRVDALERLISGAKEADRAKLVKTYLEGTDVDLSHLPDQDRSTVVLAQIHARSRRYGQNAAVICIAAVLVAVVACIAIVQSRPAAPAGESPGSDRIRLNLRAVTFGIKDDQPYVLARLSLGNLGQKTLLIDHARLGVIATSTSDGSVLTKWLDLPGTRTLAKDGMAAIDLPSTPIGVWDQMSKPSALRPAFGTHVFTFMIQFQATEGASGHRVWLDVDMPRPSFMTCDHACIAVFDIDVPAGASPYKKCTVLPAPPAWRLDCLTRESI